MKTTNPSSLTDAAWSCLHRLKKIWADGPTVAMSWPVGVKRKATETWK